MTIDWTVVVSIWVGVILPAIVVYAGVRIAVGWWRWRHLPAPPPPPTGDYPVRP